MDKSSAVDAPARPQPHRSLPGPTPLPLLGNTHQIDAPALHRQLEGWAKQYGRRFRFSIGSRRFVAITDPEAISSVLRPSTCSPT